LLLPLLRALPGGLLACRPLSLIRLAALKSHRRGRAGINGRCLGLRLEIFTPNGATPE
jgi:hypothetical protein